MMNTSRARTIVALLAVVIVFSFATIVSAASPKGKRYATPDKAVEAFIGALRNYDVKALATIFGKGSEPLYRTDDPVADTNIRTAFLALYDTKHEITQREDGALSLVVGDNAWPFPIPLVKSGKGWVFDTQAGFEEIINRRIGLNELETIRTFLTIVDAQREYYSRDRDGDGVLEFAQTFASTVGLQNGLFWRTNEGDSPSPLSEFIVAAVAEGYTLGSSSYHGYRYRLLSAQGAAAEGGAWEYLAHDNQIGGFAVLAYPIAYGETGIMTFIVNHTGVVYQRNLGAQTDAEAQKISTFDPGEGWELVPEKDLAALPAE